MGPDEPQHMVRTFIFVSKIVTRAKGRRCLKTLRIDMSKLTVNTEPLLEGYVLIGGRVLITTIMNTEMSSVTT